MYDIYKEELKDFMAQYGITQYEHDVFVMLLNGYTKPQICKKIDRTVRTAERHIAKLVKKTGSESPMRLVVKFLNYYAMSKHINERAPDGTIKLSSLKDLDKFF